MKYTKIYSSQEELDNDLANLHLDSVCFIDGGGVQMSNPRLNTIT